jgi:ATP-binding cassette subfamily B protein
MKYKRFFTDYYQQPSELPRWMKEEVEHQGDELVLYALHDLDENHQFKQKWVLLGRKAVYLEADEGLLTLTYDQIKRVSEVNGASAHAIGLIGEDEKSLAVIHFSNRQRVAFAQAKYLLDELVAGRDLTFSIDPDEQYREAVLQKLLKKQSGKDVNKKKVVWRLLGYLLPYKRSMLIGGSGAVMTTVVSLVPAYLSGYLVDNVIRPFQDGNMILEKAIQVGWVLFAGLVSTYLLKEFFIWLRLRNMSIIGEKVARDLRRDLYTHLQKLGMDFYSSKQTGSIISRVSSDTDRIWDFVAFGVVEVGIALVMLTGLGIVLVAMDWRLGLVMTLPVPMLITAIFLHGQRMQKLFLKAWRKWSALTDVLSDTIPGMQVVKAFNQEYRETRRFNKRNENALGVFIGIHQAWTKFWPGLMLGIHLVQLAVWAFAIPRLLGAENSVGYLSAGTFVSFLLYMTMFSQPIEVIGQVARMLNRATSSAYRIFEILDTEPTMENAKNAVKLHEVDGDIKFENVIFSYDGVRQILKGINFHIRPGEMIGLVGPSGGGKSTLTKLMARFYDVNSGNIKIDDHDVKNLEIGSLRRKIGMVLQDPYLFHGTVAENIGYGLENPDMKDIMEAARVANAHEFIMKFKDGYDTIVGERGQTLSGGERQRISIARAILHDPRILILDEATSAVDTETERKIQDALDKLVEGRTVIAIAHRLSTLRKANRILVVKEGDIVESGTHSELMNLGGEYKKLQDMQQEMHALMHGHSDENNINEEVKQ